MSLLFPNSIFKDDIAKTLVQQAINEQSNINREKYERLFINFTLDNTFGVSNPLMAFVGGFVDFYVKAEMNLCIVESVERLSKRQSLLSEEILQILSIAILFTESNDGLRRASHAIPSFVKVASTTLSNVFSRKELNESFHDSIEDHVIKELHRETQKIIHYALSLLLNHAKYNNEINSQEVKEYIRVLLLMANNFNYIQLKNFSIPEFFNCQEKSMVSYIKNRFALMLQEAEKLKKEYRSTYDALMYNKDIVTDL